MEIWYHTIKLQVPSFESEEEPPLIIKVYDEDEKTKREFIGSAVINIQEGIKAGWIKMNELIMPTPIWLPLRYSIFFPLYFYL